MTSILTAQRGVLMDHLERKDYLIPLIWHMEEQPQPPDIYLELMEDLVQEKEELYGDMEKELQNLLKSKEIIQKHFYPVILNLEENNFL